MVKLWYHENMRVFHDRLTTKEDRIYLKDLLEDKIKNSFKLETEQIMDTERLLFADIMGGRDTD